MSKDFAQRFAAEWIDAWNAHDLERVLSHYDDAFVMSSPLIPRIGCSPRLRTTSRASQGIRRWSR